MNINNLSSSKNCWSKLAKQSQLCLSVVLASSAVITSNSAAQAVQFDFSYAPGTSLEQRLAFEMAGNIWSSYLTDNMTVEIHVEMTDLLPDNVIGGALPGIKARQHISNVYNKLGADRISSDDYVAVDNMNLYHNNQRYRAVVDNYEVNYNQFINLTRANSKALGMLNGTDDDLDGYILMSNLTAESVDWSYNFSSNSVPNDTLDFLSVAMHEIGHVLGFVSGVDDPNWLYELSEAQQKQSNKGQTGINAPQKDSDYNQLADDETYITVLDLFRFSPESTSFANNNSDLSVGGEKFFSIDGGNTNLASFSTGKDTSLGGDGYQASHWKQANNPLGIMDPTLREEEKGTISELDLRAFDVIGYNRQSGNVNIDLSSLFNQTKQDVANDLGIWVGHLEQVLNGASYHWVDQAITYANQDRTQDVINMIETSEVYEWGYNPNGDGNGNGNGNDDDDNGNGNCNPNCNSYPQVLAGILTNEGLFSQAYWSTFDFESEPKKVPEPGVNIGLLGLGLWASNSFLKHYRKSK